MMIHIPKTPKGKTDVFEAKHFPNSRTQWQMKIRLGNFQSSVQNCVLSQSMIVGQAGNILEDKILLNSRVLLLHVLLQALKYKFIASQSTRFESARDKKKRKKNKYFFGKKSLKLLSKNSIEHPVLHLKVSFVSRAWNEQKEYLNSFTTAWVWI